MRRTLVLSLVLPLTLASVASAQSEYLARIIPVAGSTPGAEGSFFRTGLQIYNPSRNRALTGHIVYHPAGRSASDSDPRLAFTLGANGTISYTDVVEQMGQAGLGSLDIMLVGQPNASASPVIVARVFDDDGAAGTSGFTEEGVDPADLCGGSVLIAGEFGVLIAPPDNTRFRYNIGVRTLGEGGTLEFTVRNPIGVLRQVVTKSYGPDYFLQQRADSASMLGVALGPSDSIEVEVTSGSAIVYGATADSTTNDPSIQFARAVR